MNFHTETGDRLRRLDSVVNNIVTRLLGELLFAGRLLHTSEACWVWLYERNVWVPSNSDILENSARVANVIYPPCFVLKLVGESSVVYSAPTLHDTTELGPAVSYLGETAIAWGLH